MGCCTSIFENGTYGGRSPPFQPLGAEVGRGAQPWVLRVLSLPVLPLGKPWVTDRPTEEPESVPEDMPAHTQPPEVFLALVHQFGAGLLAQPHRLPVSVDGTFPRCLALH